LNTEFGKIGKSLQSIKQEETGLQKETKKVVRNLAFSGLGLCVIMALVYGFTKGDWLAGFLASITLAMAIIPEEFPVVLTVFLALGAWRISKNNVLTRRMPAIETLGSNTVLCVDKTGTLTMNQMSVARLNVAGGSLQVNLQETKGPAENFHQLIEFRS
jgi:Ca2+-transporting ATPase